VGIQGVGVGVAMATEEGPRESRMVARPVMRMGHADLMGARVAVVVAHGLVVVLGADNRAGGAARPRGRRLQVPRHVAREASQLTRHSGPRAASSTAPPSRARL
jgi:hypothetical protein